MSDEEIIREANDAALFRAQRDRAYEQADREAKRSRIEYRRRLEVEAILTDALGVFRSHRSINDEDLRMWLDAAGERLRAAFERHQQGRNDDARA